MDKETKEPKKPSWEKKYEKLKSEGITEQSIKDMEQEVKDQKAKKVNGKFKSREEYDKAVAEQNQNIADSEKKLSEKKTFLKNRDKIENILSYRNKLAERLEALPKDRSQEIARKEKEAETLGKLVESYEAKIRITQDELKQYKDNESNSEITSAAYESILKNVLGTYNDSLTTLRKQQDELNKEITALQEEAKNFDHNEVENKRMMFARKIAKCNLLAASLLRGKDINEMELNVDESKGKFTSKDGKLEKQTKAAREGQEPEKKPENSKNLPTQVSEFDKKHPRLAKLKNFFKKIGHKLSKNTSKEDKSNAEEQIKKTIEDALKEKEEDKLLKAIAEKGEETAFRDRLKVNREKAANDLATRFGGQYERQDGATATKQKEDQEGR